MPVMALAHSTCLVCASVQPHEQPPVRQALARKRVAHAVHGDAQAALEKGKAHGMSGISLRKRELVVRVLVEPPAVDAMPRGVGVTGGCGTLARPALFLG